MNKWYKKPVTKGILILLTFIAILIAAVGVCFVFALPGGLSPRELLGASARPYEESTNFENSIISDSHMILSGILLKDDFEMEGKYNPDKLVDIVEYSEGVGRISGNNQSGLAYKLGDLVDWSKDYTRNNYYDSDDESIVVCTKPDGSYHYYQMNYFRILVADGKLRVEPDNMSSSQFMSDLAEGYFTDGYSGYSGGSLLIRDENGETQYTDCWTNMTSIEEKYAPEGAENIIELANTSDEWNGNITRAYQDLQVALQGIYSQYQEYTDAGSEWQEGDTNLTYLFVNNSTKQVYTNKKEYGDFSKAEENIKKIKAGSGKYAIIKPKLKDFESNMDTSASDWQYRLGAADEDGKMLDYTFVVSVDTKFPVQDYLYDAKESYDQYAPYAGKAVFGMIFGAIVFFAAFIWLTIIAGRTDRDEELHLMMFDRWKTEISALLVIGVYVVGVYGWYSVGAFGNSGSKYYGIGSAVGIAAVAVAGIFSLACFLWGYLSLVRRIKARNLWKNSLLRSVCVLLNQFWKNRNITLKTTLLFLGFIALHWVAFLARTGELAFLMLAVDVAAGYFVVMNVIAKSRIKKGIQEIASGNVDYQIPLDHLKHENLEQAKLVNNIGDGLQRALEGAMKSERLKTDLITNVSHDIKTPLTSIINYVDLLKRENFDDPKIRGYLDILEAKAQRLKTLTEDVVEASKVSSGNIKLEFMDVNLVEMIHQTGGEFEEKFTARHLTLVQNVPEEPAVIHADGRRMWRILENIYNNAAKYAMEGTRIYADLVMDEKTVRFSLKNVSAQPLNISAEELTERFIRGDISRSTEGSGLGLSIAKSLAEMQGGKFELYLDGDLFKATIEFPKAK